MDCCFTASLVSPRSILVGGVSSRLQCVLSLHDTNVAAYVRRSPERRRRRRRKALQGSLRVATTSRMQSQRGVQGRRWLPHGDASGSGTGGQVHKAGQGPRHASVYTGNAERTGFSLSCNSSRQVACAQPRQRASVRLPSGKGGRQGQIYSESFGFSVVANLTITVYLLDCAEHVSRETRYQSSQSVQSVRQEEEV
jgi:hypothetical protein